MKFKEPPFLAGDPVELNELGDAAGIRIRKTRHGTVVMPREECGVTIVRFFGEKDNTLVRSAFLQHAKEVAKPDLQA